MKALLYKTNRSIPCEIEVATGQAALDAADADDCLWVAVQGILCGKLITGQWAKV